MTDELPDVLTKNVDTRTVKKETADTYLSLIDTCLGDELKDLATESLREPKETVDLITEFSKIHKFVYWIAPFYNIRTRFQPARKTKTFTTPSGIPVRKGTGATVIILHDFKEQMKRMLLLLRASEAGNKDANLNEFTSILETMRNNKKLSKKGYQILLQRFHS